MNRDEMLAVVEQSWQQLDGAIAGLDEAALRRPGVVGAWSIKDVLGHVTAWEQMALRHIQQARSGEGPKDLAGITMDAYNADEVARREAWPLAQVRDEAAESRRQLRAALQSVSDEEWAAPVGEGEPRRPLADWVGGALGGDTPGTHATEHAEQIRAWRA